ncbi:MAG: PIN domain-containing protein [Phycisphaerales bacterium]
MSRLCVDTSAYSRFRRGDSQVVELLDGAEWVGVPAIVVGELEAGFAAGDRGRQNQRELELFLAEVETLVVDASIARVYGEIVAMLRAAGPDYS